MMRNEMIAPGENRSASRLEADEEQREQGAGDDEDGAAHGQFLPPAVADRSNDLEKFGAAIH